jgi:hypothetical protein
VIVNGFGTGFYEKGGAALSFIFSTGGTNPSRACDAGLFEVSTWAGTGTDPPPIDYYNFNPKVDTVKTIFSSYIPTPAVLNAALGTPSSTVASAINTVYSFTITPAQQIPQNSIVVITFPATINL